MMDDYSWYLAPRFHQEEDVSDPDPANHVQRLTCPGTGDPLTPYEGTHEYTCCAYDGVDDTVLVSMPSHVDAPSDWTVKTQSQAQAHATARSQGNITRSIAGKVRGAARQRMKL